MALTAADLYWLRDHVGTEPPDSDLNGAYDVLGSRAGVALSIWSRRLADMVANPASGSSDGDSYSYAANLKAAQAKVDELTRLVADEDAEEPGSGGSYGYLRRADRTVRRRGCSESAAYGYP